MTRPIQAQALIETSDLVIALIGIFGVLIGSFISFYTTRRIEEKKSRREMTICIFDELHSEQIYLCRSIALAAMKSGAGKSFSEVYSNADAETKASLAMFMHFLEKITSLSDSNMLDRNLLKLLIGRYLPIWFDQCIDNLAPEPNPSVWVVLLAGARKLKHLR